MKHTPGPWITDPANKGMICKEIDGVYEYISNCELEYSDLFNQDEEHANARLIAAAPDLLKACETLVTHLTDALEHNLPITAETVDYADRLARLAIAKAKGK